MREDFNFSDTDWDILESNLKTLNSTSFNPFFDDNDYEIFKIDTLSDPCYEQEVGGVSLTFNKERLTILLKFDENSIVKAIYVSIFLVLDNFGYDPDFRVNVGPFIFPTFITYNDFFFTIFDYLQKNLDEKHILISFTKSRYGENAFNYNACCVFFEVDRYHVDSYHYDIAMKKRGL